MNRICLVLSLLFLQPLLQADAPLQAFQVTNPEVQRAMLGVAGAVPVAALDERRPQFHFLPPAQWNNDPNGPIYYNGYFHLFYQLNPYGDRWEHMHWGHARSKNLVSWEHLPVALWPSEELGERHCFSGCAARKPDGKLMLIYTSIGNRAPEQWGALPEDEELIAWKKFPTNPLLTEQLHGDRKIYEWRDPYAFEYEGRHYLVCGGNLNESKGGQASVLLYRAENEDLTQWSFRGVLFTHPDKEAFNIECPNFFRLGDKWVLLTSAHRNPEYFVGTFDPEQPAFTVEQRGVVDYGDYYAPNGCDDPQGRHVLWGWIRGFDFAKGWNGCMSLPRVLTLNEETKLIQRPAPELDALRGKTLLLQDFALHAEPQDLEGLAGAQWKLHLKMQAATQFMLELLPASGTQSVVIKAEAGAVWVNDARIPLEQPASAQDLTMDLFLDRAVLEVYINGGRQCFTRAYGQFGGAVGARISGAEGAGLAAEACEINGIWN